MNRTDPGRSVPAKRIYLDLIAETIFVVTVNSILFWLIMAAAFWLVFGYILGQDFRHLWEREPGVIWGLLIVVVSFQLFGYLKGYQDLVTFLDWLQSRSIRFTERPGRVDDDRFRCQFVDQPMKAKAKGTLIRGRFKTIATLAAFESGLLFTTSDRAYLLGWQDVQQVQPGSAGATLLLPALRGTTERIHVPWNRDMTGALPARFRAEGQAAEA